MVRDAPLFLALRYIKPRRSFVSVITVISVLGVMVGVMMLIVVRSVMQGLDVDLRQLLIGQKPHVIFSMEPGARDAATLEAVLAAARANPATLAATSVITNWLYMAQDKEGWESGAQVLGFPAEGAEHYLSKVRPHLEQGSLDLAPGTIVLPSYTHRKVGDEISVYSSTNVNDMVRRFRGAMDEEDKAKKEAAYKQIKLHPVKLKVAGIVRSETGGYFGFLSLATAREIFGSQPHVEAVSVEMHNPEEAAKLVAAIGPGLRGWKAEIWSDEDKARLAAMKNELFMTSIVLGIIGLVAAFSVMNTTITVTTQKRREIGVIAAIGGRARQIINIFVYQALIVGVIGTAAGLATALLVLNYRNELREAFTRLTQGQVYAVEGVFAATVPAHLVPFEIGVICLGAIGLCWFAAWLPAHYAARLEPAEALRD